MIENLHRKFNFSKIYVDEGGVGSGLVDDLLNKSFPVEAVTFTIEKKEGIYNDLRMLFEQKKISIPKDDKLIMQLLDLRYKTSVVGHLSIHHSDNGHDDYPDSLALACMGLREKEFYFGFA